MLSNYGMDNGQVVSGELTAPGGLYAAEFTDEPATSFFIELFSSDGKTVHTSEMVSKADLTTFISTSTFDSGWKMANAWDGGLSSAVPEPTSGLLLLIGAAMMGLRRKRIA